MTSRQIINHLSDLYIDAFEKYFFPGIILGITVSTTVYLMRFIFDLIPK